MPAEEQRSGGMRSGAHGGLMCPLEKGDRGIETSGSGYLRQQIRGGRKGHAERQGLGQSPNKITRMGGLNKASSDAGPELAGRAGIAAMESPQALIAPLKRGMGGLKRISDSEMHCATILFEPAVRPDPSPAFTPGRIVDDHTHIQTYKDEIQV